MSSIGAAYGLSSAWGRADYGISAVRPSSAEHNSPGNSHYTGYSEQQDTTIHAEVTKRMADGDMIVVNISGDNVVSTRKFSPTNINLATQHYQAAIFALWYILCEIIQPYSVIHCREI